MKKWLRFFPVILAMFNLLLFALIIQKNEQHLANGQSIFVELVPVDPRSLIQGDYMRLSYNLNFSDDMIKSWDNLPINRQSQIKTWAMVNDKRQVMKTDITHLSNSIAMVLNNPTGDLSQIYPASRSFLFAEGLADCYQKAKFAHFKVNPQGKMILADLVDGDLQSLHCEKKQR